MWRKPVGLGAMRTRTDMGWLGYRRALRRPLLGRDQGQPRPRDRDRRRRRAALRAEPAHVALPRARRRGSRAVPRAARGGGHRRRARARALPLQPRDAPTRRSTARASTRCARRCETACAIGADGVVFHVGSHLGTGFEAGLERCVPALREVLELCSDTTWLLLENSAGAGGTMGRSVDELAALVDALDSPSAARDLPRLLPPLRLRRRRRRSGGRRRDARRSGHADRPRPAPRAPCQRRGGAARLEPRPARERARGRARRAPRRLPCAPGRPEPPGRDGDARPRRPRTGRGRDAEAPRPARPLAAAFAS